MWEKLQTLFLILFGVGAFVWRMVQKMRETTAQESRQRPASSVPPLPNASFQELLKQMQQQNNPPTPTAVTRPATRPAPPQAQPRAELPQRETVLPGQTRATEVAARATQHPKQRGPEPGAPARPLAELLRNPADVRTAFVLAEILKRKYE